VSVDTALTARSRPSALGGDLRRFWSLTYTLAATDFKLRFFGSALGYLWTLMRPLMLFGVLYFVFTEVVRFGGDIKDYPVYLLSAIMLFTFFSETTARGVTSLVERENLLRKVRFPRMVIPLAVTLTALFNLGMTLIAVAIFAVISGVYPTWGWLELPVIILLLALLATGIGMLLSSLYVRYRDMQPIWDVTQQVLFYASPILYVATLVPPKYQHAYMCNPLASLLSAMRHAVVDPTAPTAATLIGGTARLLIPLGLIAIAVVIGAWVFNREAPRIAENL
jgi:ABC-2 type transport system permease protein